MQVRLPQRDETPFRIQRDGPSPAEQAHDALQQHLSAEMGRVSAEISKVASSSDIGAGDRSRILGELRAEMTALATQMRELESEQREAAIEAAAHATAARALGGRATTSQAGRREPEIPPEAVDISIAFFVCVAAAIILFPLVRSLGRILERRAAPPQRLDPDAAGQLVRMEQALDAVAIEVERIAEGQRYTAKLLAERDKAPSLSR